MNTQAIQNEQLSELRALLADVLDVDEEDIGYETHFINDLGVDSLMALEVMVTLEKRYQIKLSEADLRAMSCLRDVNALLSERLTRTPTA